MSTNDEEDPVLTPPTKDISDMIQITNEIAFVDEPTGEEDDVEAGLPDCLLGTNCPIDIEETTKNIKGAIDEHVVPKVDETTQSIRGAYVEHVAPKVDETTKSIVGAYEEHVVPKVDGTRQSIVGAFEEHVAPKVDGTTKTIVGAFEEHVVPKVGETTETIKGAYAEHVVPKIDFAKEQSIRTMDTFTTESQRIMTEAQENSKKGMEEVQKQSQAFLENSKSTMDGVAAQAKAIVDEKVVPEFQKAVETSQGVVTAAAEEVQTHAPCYMGSAPGFAGLASVFAPFAPWMWSFKEGCFRAYGMVVFCDNPVTGIFIFLGLLFGSPLGAFCSLLSVLTANATAFYLDLDMATMARGQYAKNAVLVGTGIVDCFGFDFPETGNLKSGVSIVIFLSIAFAPAAVILETIWVKKVPSGTPSLLFPANIVLVATMLCAKVWNVAMSTQIVFEGPAAGILKDEVENASSKFWMFEAIFNGVSKIFFVDGTFFSAFFILIGVLLCSRIVAASLLAGSFVSSVVLGYMIFQENHWYLNAGYAGFNAALTVAGIFYYLVPSLKLTGLGFFAVVATVIVQGAVDVVLGILGIPVATSLGFCFTLIALLVMDIGSFFGQSEDYFIRLVPDAELSTPEEYLKSIGIPSTDQPTDSSSEDDDLEKNIATEETPLIA